MSRRRFFRIVRVRLECGCLHDIHTGRWRVTKDLVACIFGDSIRRGVWCFKHNGMCLPTELLGIARDVGGPC